MKIAQRVFGGEVPRLAPRALPESNAVTATNCRLLSADLEAWRNYAQVQALAKAGTVNAIHLMDSQYWLHWVDSELGAGQSSVDVALGAVPADTTERTYFTGLDAPRVTNISKATTGGSGGGYPYASLKLGVPEPDDSLDPAVAQAVDTNFLGTVFDGTALDGWTTSEQLESGTSVRYVDVSGGRGRLRAQNQSDGAYLHKDLRLTAPICYIEFQFETDTFVNWILCADEAGAGTAIEFSTAGRIAKYGIDGWGQVPTAFGGQVAAALSAGNTYTVKAFIRDATAESGSATVTLAVTGPAVSVSATFKIERFGGNCGFQLRNSGGSIATSYVDNVATVTPVSASASRYVYTLVNEFSEEGPPSDPTSIVYLAEGFATTITTPTTVIPSGDIAARGLTHKRIYRAVTGDGSTQYHFVAQIALGTANYVDSAADEDIGRNDVLESEDYDLPPTDGHSIISLPNGITAMASKNQVCPSAINRPHAYPVDFRLTTEFKVVGLGAIDTNIVVATRGNPYLVTGSDPAALSMSKLELPQGCVSKESIASLLGFGVIYASPDGLVGVSAVGSASVITSSFLTPKEWRAFNPSSIKATVHDDRYFGFYDAGGGNTGGFVFDPKNGGAGWSKLDFYSKAWFYDTATDRLYFVVGSTLQEWEAGAGLRPYTYRSKEFKLERPASFCAAQIKAENYDSLTLKLYGDGVLFHTQAITSESEFVIPPKRVTGDETTYRTFQYELTGTAPVQEVQFAEDMDELG
jgi:hypothetical protein